MSQRAIAVFPGEKRVRLIEHAAPRIERPTDVRIRVLEVGVCGTDREICAFDYGTPPAGSDHLVIGHESVGQVVEVGSGVESLRPGDVVVPTVRRPCRHATCHACGSGRQDFCFTGDFSERGINGLHGFMTEFVVEDAANLNAVPAALREVAVLVEPLTIAEKALSQVWHLQERLPWGCAVTPGRGPGRCHRAVVIGAGPVGMLGAMKLAASGFDTTVYSREPAPNPRQQLVEAIGARYVSSAETPVEMLAAIAGPIDLVYEAVGASSIAFELMKVLGTNGVFVFTGVPGRREPMPVDTDLLMRNLVLKNQLVLGTVNAGKESFENAIVDLADFQQRWPQALSGLISGRHPMEDHAELLLGRPSGIKNVIRIGAAA